MRHAILLDNKITDAEYKAWVKEDSAFWQKYIGVTPEYTLIRTDYTDYPTYIDGDGDVRPTYDFLKSLNDVAVAKLGEFGFDFAMVMVHEDNWKSDPPGPNNGIWGTNYSYVYGKQCLEYCRWDRDNSANTFGTAYHERHHSFDALIKQETGVIIEPALGVDTGRYDYCITHGKCSGWDYIRHKENVRSLKIMKPDLVKALTIRKNRHQQKLDTMLKIIEILKQIVYLLRMQLNKKDGVAKDT